MYAIVTDNEITKFINHPKSLVIGDVRYPAKIFSVWSASELNAIGIYEVVTDSTIKKMRSGILILINLMTLMVMKLQLLMELQHQRLM